MAMFKRPKDIAKPPTTPVSTARKDAKMAEDLGLDDLGDDDLEESDRESDRGGKDSDDENGMSMIQFFTLQKSLRKVTEQKLELTEQLKDAHDALRKARQANERAATASRQQVIILKNAQQAQINEYERLLVDMKEAINEGLQEPTEKSEAVIQLSETITTLSNEKREQYERAENAEFSLKQALADLQQLEADTEGKIAELKKELAEAQRQLDPVKAAQASGFANAAMDNAEIEALRTEAAELRSKLRDAELSKPSAGGSGASSAEVTRMHGDLKELQSRNREMKEELNEAHAQLAKLKAVAAQGSDAERARAALEAEMTAQQTEIKKKNRELERQIEELTQKLRSEGQARDRAQQELTDIKSALDGELRKAQGAAAAGEDAKKSVESRLQAATQELASERAGHKAEVAAHQATRTDLEAARASLAKLKEEMAKAASDHGSELQKEKERAVSALQKAKAEAAAEIAEVKQRAKDSMRDLQERLGTFASKVQPMVETIRFLSKNYKELKKQTRELQGEIAPAVKQCKRDLLRTLAEVDKQYKEMVTKYRREMALRKKLHNELVDLKGNIRVYGRVRPIIHEDGGGEESKVICNFDREDDQMVYVQNKGKTTEFQLDHVFKMDSKQDEVFAEVRDLIVSVVDGFNICIFAYGQTGSGKTFTMEGNDAHPGLNRRALAELFNVVLERKVDWSFELEVSVLEIYNENLRDLLADNPKTKLDIKHGKDGPYVPGLSSHPVRSAEEVREKFKQAQKNRATATTQMNDVSSRSHALLIVTVTGTNLSTGVQTKGKLNLIDLAGSERVAKSGALEDEDRFKEATNINKSLSALGDVIHALGSKQKHIPYRNSKLTHLLQDSLGGHAKTLMVVQLSPVLKNVGETICSLNFAARVRAVELGPSKKAVESAEMAALKKRVAELESQK